MASATVELFMRVVGYFKPTAGKFHYQFSLHDLDALFRLVRGWSLAVAVGHCVGTAAAIAAGWC